MQGAQYFIEQYKDNKGKELQGPISDIKNLNRNLSITTSSTTLHTTFVWQIKLKPGVQMPQPQLHAE